MVLAAVSEQYYGLTGKDIDTSAMNDIDTSAITSRSQSPEPNAYMDTEGTHIMKTKED